MKKLNVHSIFFRLAVLFIITVIGILTIVVFAFSYFQKSNPEESPFISTISHIHRIVEDIEDGKIHDLKKKMIKKESSGKDIRRSKERWRYFRRFTVSVFEKDKLVFSDAEHDFTLKDFLQKSKKVKGFENTVSYKNESFMVFKKADKMIVIGNKRRKRHRKIKFKSFTFQLAVLIFLLLLIIYYFIHKLLIPVNKLLPALNEIRRGNFDYQIDFSTNNEFQAIIESFNEMASQINIMFQNNLLLIGNISHDLKYYLTRMKVQVEIDIEDEDTKKSFNEDIDKMTEYIDRTVEVYQANANKTQFKIKSVNISKLISEKYNNADIEIKILENDLITETDENYFSIILDNLYDNALKYGISENSKSVVKLSLMKKNDLFELIIENKTSFNFVQNEMNLLFQPFYRKDSARSQDIQGTGLGLFIVRQIADSLELKTELSIEDGNVFTVKISGSLR